MKAHRHSLWSHDNIFMLSSHKSWICCISTAKEEWRRLCSLTVFLCQCFLMKEDVMWFWNSQFAFPLTEGHQNQVISILSPKEQKISRNNIPATKQTKSPDMQMRDPSSFPLLILLVVVSQKRRRSISCFGIWRKTAQEAFLMKGLLLRQWQNTVKKEDGETAFPKSLETCKTQIQCRNKNLQRKLPERMTMTTQSERRFLHFPE